jgi:hypothetical protein
MLRLFLALALLGAGTGAAQAECSVAVQKRWENAMRELTQLERLPWRERYNPDNIALQCRMKDVLVETSAAAKEYFHACDPLRADRAHVAVEHVKGALAQFDASRCSKSQAASARKK